MNDVGVVRVSINNQSFGTQYFTTKSINKQPGMPHSTVQLHCAEKLNLGPPLVTRVYSRHDSIGEANDNLEHCCKYD